MFRSFPAVLGVSKTKNYEVNSIAVPRKPGETFGAICKLQPQSSKGKPVVINIEYNHTENYFKKSVGGE